MLGIFDVTNELTGRLMDKQPTLDAAKASIAEHGNVGYIYAVRTMSDKPQANGIPVASFRVRAENYRRAC